MGKKDFFLDPDDAQTMGNINYMRMAKKVRRTFPKTLKNPDGFAIEKSVASEKNTNFSGVDSFQPKSIANNNNNQPQSSFKTPASKPITESKFASKPMVDFTSSAKSTSKRNKGNDGLDMFRNMAKDIRKGK
jgi:hypothetical protein